MIVIARKGRVAAPVEQVWETVRCSEALASWLTGVRQVSTRGPEGLGRLLRLTGTTAAGEVEREVEIIAWRAPTLLAWRCVGARRVGDGRGGGDGTATERPGDGRWDVTGPAELHIQLGSSRDDTQVRLYAVCPAGPGEGLRLRLGPVRRWRVELARSISALSALAG